MHGQTNIQNDSECLCGPYVPITVHNWYEKLGRKQKEENTSFLPAINRYGNCWAKEKGADKLSVFYFPKFGGVLRHISSSAEITVFLRGAVTKVHIQDTRFRS
jgi:hypothetical protein